MQTHTSPCVYLLLQQWDSQTTAVPPEKCIGLGRNTKIPMHISVLVSLSLWDIPREGSSLLKHLKSMYNPLIHNLSFELQHPPQITPCPFTQHSNQACFSLLIDHTCLPFFCSDFLQDFSLFSLWRFLNPSFIMPWLLNHWWRFYWEQTTLPSSSANTPLVRGSVKHPLLCAL